MIRQAAELSLMSPRVLITPMIEGRAEVVVGAYRDFQFGPVVMVGIGGVLIEVLKDVTFRMAPLSPDDANGMIAELKGSALFSGVRGRAPIPIRPIADLLCRVSEMIAATPDIAEIDINPVIVSESDALIADARIVLAAPAARAAAIDSSDHVGR
jgi:acyl-CoA synthetase (NDP forming)